MYGYSRLVIGLLLFMCVVRATIAGYGYLAPGAALELYGMAAEAGGPVEYLMRVWGARDVALAVLVATASRHSLRPIVIACIVIELSDTFSAFIGFAHGYFDFGHLVAQLLTIGVALVPESLALALVYHEERMGAPDSAVDKPSQR